MSNYTASAIAHPNIAFIKYWGNKDEALHVPLNGSLSMNLDGLDTRTTVTFDEKLKGDQLTINRQPFNGQGLERVSTVLTQVRALARQPLYARVESENNFPSGAGVASSAAAFSALALAASTALGLDLSEKDISRLARIGSGSACRSIPDGFVEWLPGESDDDSYAVSIAEPNHWQLVDLIVIVNRKHKAVGSARGMASAHTSPLQANRISTAPSRLRACRDAILNRDFAKLAQVAEEDSRLMHAVMRSSTPPLFYTQPITDEIIHKVLYWRDQGGHAGFSTVDAGPNVHVICLAEHAEFFQTQLQAVEGVIEVLRALPSPGARLLPV